MLAFVALIALVACTSENNPTATAVSTATATTAPEPATAIAQPSPSPTLLPPDDLVRGGILRFAIKEAPPHQDPHQSVSSVLATWGAGIAYSRLFRFQRGKGVPVPSRIPECDLCESWKQTGPLEFEFKMRKDAFWPDIPPLNGRRVTAEDVVFSYKRQMNPGWPNAELLANIQEVVAFNDDRLRIRLHTLDAEFFEKLANGRSVVIASEVVQLNGDLLNGPTIGSGPWILEEVSAGAATFEANRNYYEGDRPYADGLSVQFIQQDSTRATGVRAGLLDFVETSLDEVNLATERFPDLRTVSILRPGTGVELALNTVREPLVSLSVRQAVLLAWALEAAMDNIWSGELAPSVGLNLPDSSWSTDFAASYSDMFGDPDAANFLLNEAKRTLANPVTITVGEFGETQEDDRYVQVAQSLADALNSLGLAASILRVPTRLFADNVWLRGDYDIFIGAPPPVSSLSGQLFGIYHSTGPWNTTGYSTPVLDDLIERQAVEFDLVERRSLLLQIQDEIMAGSHRFYPGTGVTHWLWRPNVQDFFPDISGDSGDFLTKIWIRQ